MGFHQRVVSGFLPGSPAGDAEARASYLIGQSIDGDQPFSPHGLDHPDNRTQRTSSQHQSITGRQSPYDYGGARTLAPVLQTQTSLGLRAQIGTGRCRDNAFRARRRNFSGQAHRRDPTGLALVPGSVVPYFAPLPLLPGNRARSFDIDRPTIEASAWTAMKKYRRWLIVVLLVGRSRPSPAIKPISKAPLTTNEGRTRGHWPLRADPRCPAPCV